MVTGALKLAVVVGRPDVRRRDLLLNVSDLRDWKGRPVDVECTSYPGRTANTAGVQAGMPINKDRRAACIFLVLQKKRQGLTGGHRLQLELSVIISRKASICKVMALFFDARTAITSISIIQRFDFQAPAAMKVVGHWCYSPDVLPLISRAAT